VQAALASAASFAVGAAPPVLAAAVAPPAYAIPAIVGACLLCLALLGGAGARLGGAPSWRSIVRTLFWGALAMAVTAGAGHLFGAAI
ncbi:VIT1/CCC1 transporter family protein, partial [Sphingobium sp. C100]|uniref:VIT1/CCC1 transporter family protein n=1 Tax=Sphingobium sp. C100 TaxID=1207055 RepID=UPI0004CF8A8E